jgi:hypothetical protein
MFNPEDEDLPSHFDESIYKPEDKPEEMYICSVCSKLLEPAWEQWICNFCMNYDSHAYKYAHKLNQQNESDYD